MSLNPMDWIKEGLNYFLYNFVYTLLYYMEIGLCMVIDWIQELMDIFTGIKKVTYTTDVGSPEDYLISIFFSNGAITGVYLGMAAIGIVLAFTFAIISVIRKAFDLDDKVKMSIGQILTNLLKTILLIVGLNVGMTVIIMGTNILIQQVVYVFDHAEDLSKGNDHIEYTDEQYAAMARIFNTIGNYSLNPSYKNRYNVNSCYNEIRGDLNYLADQGVFKFYYETRDENNEVMVTWQSLLQELANAADYTRDVPVDVYNEGIANAIYDVMAQLKANANIPVLSSYDRIEEEQQQEVKLGKTLFLIGTMGNGVDGAAKNSTYNEHPSFTDPVRAPYYRGTKNVYRLKDVNKDFDIGLTKMNYLVVYVAGVALALNMAIIIVNSVARIFNLLFLYLIAPPIFAIMPLDDGGKTKQWTTAFLVQAFSVFATIISMRVYLLFLPIILSPGLILSNNIVVDMVGRVALIFAGIEAISRANGILTGILADNAGWQSISAGDMSNYFKGSFAGAAMTRTTGFMNTMPARLVGGNKFANWVSGKQNRADAKTSGALGMAYQGTIGLGKLAYKGVKMATPSGNIFSSKGKKGDSGAAGAGGTAGAGNAAGASSAATAKGSTAAAVAKANTASGTNTSPGTNKEEKEAAIPPPQRNVGG